MTEVEPLERGRAALDAGRWEEARAASTAAMSLCITWISNFDNHAAAGGWLARDSGDPDLELCALGDPGLTLVTEGRAGEGLALIDEAMAGTLGGEHRRFDTVVTACCDMLIAGDLRRAAQWCQVADQFIDRYGCPFLFARCRTIYGGILVAKGRWAEAERELLAAIRMAEGAGPATHAEALARLADLRLRQGRLEEAEELLPERGGRGGGGPPGRAGRG